MIFICQVLEYQPEPLNQWTTVGQLETGRRYHAILSIGSEALPCLPGYLYSLDRSIIIKIIIINNIFITIILLVRIVIYTPLL